MYTLGTKVIVLISEVPGRVICIYGTWLSVLIKQGVLISEVSFKRGSTVEVVSPNKQASIHTHTQCGPAS